MKQISKLIYKDKNQVLRRSDAYTLYTNKICPLLSVECGLKVVAGSGMLCEPLVCIKGKTCKSLLLESDPLVLPSCNPATVFILQDPR